MSIVAIHTARGKKHPTQFTTITVGVTLQPQTALVCSPSEEHYCKMAIWERLILRVLKSQNLVHIAAPPIKRAMLFICEKCGKRAVDAPKQLSYRLASKLKRAFKETHGKRDMRIVLTSCMNICPEGRIAVSIQPIGPVRPVFLEMDASDSTESISALIEVLSGLVGRLPRAHQRSGATSH